MLKQEFIRLIGRIEELENGKSSAKALPENCYFLDRDTILCYPRGSGDSRYPYGVGGYTLWAHSSGNLSINESTFYVIQPSDGGKEPYLAFFGGIKDGEYYIPVSVTGVARQPMENVKRYTVYTPKCVYYIARTQDVDFCLRCFNGSDEDKQTSFSLLAVNKSNVEKECYLSGFFNCLLMYSPYESIETKWFKSCKAKGNDFYFHSVIDIDRNTHMNNFAVLKVNVSDDRAEIINTTSRSDFVGGMSGSLYCAESLFRGNFRLQKQECRFTDTAVGGNIVKFRLGGGEEFRTDYILKVFTDMQPVDGKEKELFADFASLDRAVTEAARLAVETYKAETMLNIQFGQSRDGYIDGELLSLFVHSVQRQVTYCALAKNSGVSLLGIRDVFQQIEAALIWAPAECRAKILEALSFTNVDGRLPRQYSLPPRKGAIPQMDLRAFIDQGVWVINTIYQYLCYTGEYSLLESECDYLDFTDGVVKLTEQRGTVLDHLLKITEYLIEHIDHGHTDCLRIMYGDWNDALDGLGATDEEGKDFGTGVSVMATLQFYANLQEMIEILGAIGGYENTIERYAEYRLKMKSGLERYAIVERAGEKRILHGWGDKYGYQVGGFADVDGKARDALVVNAYWAISGAIEWDRSMKKDILASYRRLDSKYGLKTFEPFFEKGTKGVGRIANLPKGTAENAATYIHATLFGIWSLFRMNESRLAFEQIKKILPITHEHISTSPFIMPNSYVYNEEYGMDGESMSDWFTGSANVLIKIIVRYIFGIQPSLDGLNIQPASYIPFDSCSIHIQLKNCLVTLEYQNKGVGERKFIVNETEYESFKEQDSFYAERIFLKNELQNNSKLLIFVVD